MDAAAALRGQLEEKDEEIKQLKKMNHDTQQSLSLVQYEHDRLKQDNQKLMEDSRSQVSKTILYALYNSWSTCECPNGVVRSIAML